MINKSEIGGIGRIFKLEKDIMLTEFIKKIKKDLDIKNMRAVFDNDKIIKKVAVINGSGMSYFNMVKNKNVDVFLTGDIKYHEALEALEAGVALIDIGHYESECFFGELIKENLKDIELEIDIFNSKPVFENF